MDHRRGGQQCALHVDDGWERLVVDADLRDRILRGGSAFGHHGCDRLADPGRALERQGKLGGGLHALQMRQRGNPRLAVLGEIASREQAQHARHLQRVAAVDGPDARMRMRAAHECHVHHAREHDVVDVLATALHQFFGVGPWHGLADIGVGPVDGPGIDDLVHDPALALRLAAVLATGIDDGVIARAAAVVAGQVLADFRACGLRVAGEQVGRG